MTALLEKQINIIRKFNRYYTNILGLLDQHLLKSTLSLAEVRLLYEVEHNPGCTSKMIANTLCIDAGYLSRLLKGLEHAGYLTKTPSATDARAYSLMLTDAGRAKIKELGADSSKQIAGLIKPLTDSQKAELVKNMTSVAAVLTEGRQITPDNIELRTEIKSGDAGYITYLHGQLYKEEYGYSTTFEAYVAQSFYDFLLHYNQQKDRLWCAEHNGKIIGCIGVAAHGERAQLRWFLVDPLYRHIGLGKKLLHAAISFAKERGYKSIYLDTTSDLEKAIGLYTSAGFKKTGEKPNNSWSEGVTELEYAMDLQ